MAVNAFLLSTVRLHSILSQPVGLTGRIPLVKSVGYPASGLSFQVLKTCCIPGALCAVGVASAVLAKRRTEATMFMTGGDVDVAGFRERREKESL
jgi:hypothetical protein